MRGIATRRLRYAIAASLILHALVLWPTHPRLLTKDAPSPLQATLRAPEQRSAEAAPPEPAKPLPRAVPPAPTPVVAPVAAPRAAETPLLESPRPAPVPQPPSGPAESVAKASPAAAPASQSASGSLLTEATASGEARDGLRVYLLAVAAQAKRFKRYPAQAMASGWTGTAEIRVEVGSDGRPHAASVARSSGYEVLDRAALSTIDAGALRARLPDSLRGRSFAVVLPVVFNLDDE
jgi:protein TonB